MVLKATLQLSGRSRPLFHSAPAAIVLNAAGRRSEAYVRLLHDRRVPMRDGISLSADVYLPLSGGPHPTIVQWTPYESTRERFVGWGAWFAQRGYAAVVVVLGTFLGFFAISLIRRPPAYLPMRGYGHPEMDDANAETPESMTYTRASSSRSGP